MREEGAEITIDARRFAGVWANAVRVTGVTTRSRSTSPDWTRSNRGGSSSHA